MCFFLSFSSFIELGLGEPRVVGPWSDGDNREGVQASQQCFYGGDTVVLLEGRTAVACVEQAAHLCDSGQFSVSDQPVDANKHKIRRESRHILLSPAFSFLFTVYFNVLR